MLLILLITVVISILLIGVAFIKGWLFLPIIWIGCSLILVFISWGAIAFIKPRCPDWWERNIAGGIDNNFIES
jgi:hypothetical protein